MILRFATILFVLIAFSSCDPFYSLTYMVRNDSQDQLVIKFKDYPDSVVKVDPHTSFKLEYESGVGYAKDRFKTSEYPKWFAEHAMMVCTTSDNKICRQSTNVPWKLSVKGNIGMAELKVE